MPAKARGAERDQPRALGLERRHPVLVLEPRGDPDVEVDAVLDDLVLRHPLEEHPRPAAVGCSIADARFRSSSGTPTDSRNAIQASIGSSSSASSAPGGPGMT
jgi:hypothetical protein